MTSCIVVPSAKAQDSKNCQIVSWTWVQHFEVLCLKHPFFWYYIIPFFSQYEDTKSHTFHHLCFLFFIFAWIFFHSHFSFVCSTPKLGGIILSSLGVLNHKRIKDMLQQLGGTSNSSVLHREAVFAIFRLLPQNIHLEKRLVQGSKQLKLCGNFVGFQPKTIKGNLLGANYLNRNYERFM